MGTSDGVERVKVSAGHACWMCGLPAVCGEKLPSRRRKVRGLCQVHADAVFGPSDPPWRRLEAKTQREIVDEWLRGLTILAGNDGGCDPQELMAEIAAVNEVERIEVRLGTPLLPGDAQALAESQQVVSRLRGREATVHSMITLILIGWLAEATGTTRSQVLQRLALAIDDLFSGPPPGQAPAEATSAATALR